MQARSVAGLVSVVLAVALPGCLAPDPPQEPSHLAVSTPWGSSVTLEQGPAASASRGPESYWFVYVTGVEHPSIVTCDRGFSYDVDLANQTVSFSPEAHPIDAAQLESLVAYSVDR